MPVNIGIDIMGGDFAPAATLAGVKLILPELSEDTQLTLFGDVVAIQDYIAKENLDASKLNIVHCTEVISMHEHPTKAITKKLDASITKGFVALKSGDIHAFTGAGNTGAMLVGAMMSIKSIPGVVRPSIASLIPKLKGGYGIILDVGANADCRPDSLVQFAILGSMYATEILGIENPKVGLLSIGEEDEKGNLTTQAANRLFRENENINFYGNIEGRDLFNEKVDVIVCDGFVGNIVLKMAESFYDMVKSRSIEDTFFNEFNYEKYGGSPILGLNKPVIIGHGISNDIAIKNMIAHAIELAKSGIEQKIQAAFN